MFWKITLFLKKFKADRSKNCLGFHKLHLSTLWVEKEGYMTIIKTGHWAVNFKVSGTIKLQFCRLHAALQFSGLSIGCLWTSDRITLLLPPAHMKCLLNCHFSTGGFWYFFSCEKLFPKVPQKILPYLRMSTLQLLDESSYGACTFPFRK